jgi:hypothetical protein
MLLDENIHVIVKMKFGAHLYGTATSESDIDYKGVFLPSREQVLLGRIPRSYTYTSGTDRSKNTAEDVDYDCYSLHHFLKLACEGQTVAMDMLHAPDDMIVEKSAIWESIVKDRHLFYTRNLKSLIEYSRRQASKYGIKGSRINSALQVLEVLKAEDRAMKLRDIWDRLPRIEHCFDLGIDPNGMRQYQVCGKIFQESASIHYVIPILEKFYDDYGGRARLAAENKDIDWKAISHAFRAAYQTKEILTTGTIKFPLANASFLVKIKQGRIDYLTEVEPALEGLMDEVEELSRNSTLPDHVDDGYWDNFICDVLEKKLF